MLNGIFTALRNAFTSANDVFLSFIIPLPHPVFITFLAGQPIFSSIAEKTFLYFFSISWKHFTSIFSSDQKICSVTFFCPLSVKRCFATPRGLRTYPSAFMNSVRRCNSCFFSPYLSKISFTIWRKAQSVYQSIGAKQSFILHVYGKPGKFPAGKRFVFAAIKCKVTSCSEDCVDASIISSGDWKGDSGSPSLFYSLHRYSSSCSTNGRIRE